ncbi:hypothetical protein ACFVVA_23280 [Kitasatospora sp. NPDC058048]|uniref:hypothetical protein n=1 Tax=Kitasatospora sp. NPDC058048 TaxID=3346313 RepID=UPI0036DD3093
MFTATRADTDVDGRHGFRPQLPEGGEDVAQMEAELGGPDLLGGTLTANRGRASRQVDRDRRHEAVVTLRELGRSHDYRDRADAGHGLAGFAEMQEARGPLLELVLDPGDTFVTRVTAEAVLRRKDKVGLAVIASALAVADSNHSEWIHTAILDVFSIFSEDRDNAMRLCEEMLRDTDDRVALGARQLHEILAEIDPVLRPVQYGANTLVRVQALESPSGHPAGPAP